MAAIIIVIGIVLTRAYVSAIVTAIGIATVVVGVATLAVMVLVCNSS